MEVREGVLEQAQFSKDVRDNGRLLVIVSALSQSALPPARRVVRQLRSLPPFLVPDNREAVVSLRVLSSVPSWAQEKNKPQQNLHRRKLVACFLGVASCRDADELTDANSNYNREASLMGRNVLSKLLVVFGSENRLGAALRGFKSNWLLVDPGSGALGKEDRVGPQANGLSQRLFECLGQSLAQLIAMQRKEEESCRSIAKKLEGNLTLADEETQKHLRARSLKYLADLELMRGYVSSAARHYREAHTSFKQVKDYLWMGGALEGVLSTALLVKGNSEDLPKASDALLLQQAQTKADDMKTGTDTDFHNGVMGTPQPCPTLDRETAADEGEADNEIDLVGPPEDIHQLLEGENLEKMYQNTLAAYSKLPVLFGGRVRLEFLMKFASFQAERKKRHQACVHVMQILAVVSGEQCFLEAHDQLCAYLVLAAICKTVGLHRKSLFMVREAIKMIQEMNVTRIGLTQQACDLLQMCISAHRLSDPQKPLTATHQGWPLLQASLLYKYVHLCRTLERDNLVISWGWFLLQHFHSHLTAVELRTVTESIAECTKAASTMDAPFPMAAVPHVTIFKPRLLAPQLAVKQSRSLFRSAVTPVTSSNAKGPFLVSMMGRRKKNESVVAWAQGDPAEVTLTISNPLPFELRVEKMCMILEGAKVTTHPSNITLPPRCEPQQFVLLCIPNQPGTVSLIGYHATFLGLYNRCLWKQTDESINVLPSLPQLRAKIFPTYPTDYIDMSVSFQPLARRSSIDYFELLDGEECKCEFQFQSIGDVPVDHMRISLLETTSDYCHFVWDDSDVKALLPLTEKNKIYAFFCKAHAQIPAYLRVGSCKILPVGVHTHSSLSYSQARMSSLEGQRTLPRPYSTQEEGLFAMKRNSSSLYRQKRASQPISHFSNSPLMESLDLSEPPKVSGTAPSSNGFQQLGGRSQTLGQPTSERHPPVPQSPLHQLIRSNGMGSNNSSPRSSGRKKLIELFKPSLPTSPSHALTQQTAFRSPDVRLVDSLNLELALSEGLVSHAGQDRGAVAGSNFTRSGSAGEMELDKVSCDKMSLKSDPGTIPASESYPVLGTPSPPTLSTYSPKQLSSTLPVGEVALSAAQDRRVAFTDKFGSSKPLKIKKSGQTGTPRHRVVDGTRSIPLISPPTGPVVKAVRRPPKSKVIKTTFLVQYTGGQGSKEGYYREVTMEIAMTIRPTVVFDAFFVSVVKRSIELFSFTFNMENISPYPLEVTFKIDQAGLHEPCKMWFMDATESRKVTLHLKKFTVPDAEPNDVKPYSKRLVELIQISWSQDDQAKTGTLALSGLQLPLSALHIMRPLPVLYETSLYHRNILIAPDHTIAPGSTVELRVQLTNNSGEALLPSLAILNPSLGEEGGQRQPRTLKGMVVASPSLVHRIPRLPVDGTYTFAVSLLFLCTGNYFINIKHYATKTRQSVTSMPLSPPPSVSVQPDSRPSETSVVSVDEDPTSVSLSTTQTVPVIPMTCSSIRTKSGSPADRRRATPTPVPMESSLPLSYSVGNDASHDIQMFVSRSQSYLGPCINIHVSYALQK